MTKNNGFKVAALAASIALAMVATSAMAADPAAGQLPGQGKVTTGTAPVVVVDNTAHTMVIPLTTDTVINWGKGTTATDINNTGTAGFNIGSGATVTFSGSFNALNIDSTGNASQIFGELANSTTKNVWVANSNGIIVGASGVISGGGTVGLLANSIDTIYDTTTFAGNVTDYQGTGGDVTIKTGATIATGLIVSGGGMVNVDLSGATGAVSLVSAGKSAGGNPLAVDNKSASVNVTGEATTGTTVAELDSAGTATTNGMLTATASAVDGMLTNTGDLTLANAGDNGSVHNMGKLTTAAGSSFDSFTNDGSFDGTTAVEVNGGNLTNNGSITNAGAVMVTNGAIVNNGTMADVTTVTTASTDAAHTGFTALGQYYINNAGTISGTGGLTISANAGGDRTTVTKNDSTGSFMNTGTLQVAADGDALSVTAQNNVSLGGTLKSATKTVSDTHFLGNVTLTADAGQNETGALSVLTPVSFDANTADLSGAQVKIMSNVSGGGTSAPSGTLNIVAGAAQTSDYAIRVASGKTASADTITVAGYGGTINDMPNTILQGTVAGQSITFGSGALGVGDLISGPAGGLVTVGAAPAVAIHFTGRVKTAPYLNDPNNFRYNYLPITNKGTGTLGLTLNPVAYQTNGTSNNKSGVNILVNGDVNLASALAAPGQATAATAVTGVTTWPNTHLVLQSTGDITTVGAFYWPGYVYLGTVDSTTAGAAMPGTLSDAGKITLGGDFNNVLPGDVAGASGIHFMTGNALVGGGNTVRTNANAWVNFPTDLLTQSYAQGLLTDPTFEGGVANGLIVNYGTLDASMFHTHPVDATK